MSRANDQNWNNLGPGWSVPNAWGKKHLIHVNYPMSNSSSGFFPKSWSIWDFTTTFVVLFGIELTLKPSSSVARYLWIQILITWNLSHLTDDTKGYESQLFITYVFLKEYSTGMLKWKFQRDTILFVFSPRVTLYLLCVCRRNPIVFFHVTTGVTDGIINDTECLVLGRWRVQYSWAF